jgi:TPR repeat protein
MAREHRIALVIGNGNYRSAPLVNPVNDARAMSEALRSVGFRVTLLEDATLRQMFIAAREFGDTLQQGGVGLFFYAGHGMQIKGRNYLIPIGTDIQREDEVSFNAFDAGLLLEKMEAARSRVNIVILDACRNNPFSRSFRSSSQGLAQMDAPIGSYVSFATAPSKLASDGKDGNGLYTQHLLAAMRTPGLKIEDVFKRVRVGVMSDSKGQQIPWDNSSLMGDFYFTPPELAATTATSLAESHGAARNAVPASPPRTAAAEDGIAPSADTTPAPTLVPTADKKVLLAKVPPSSPPATSPKVDSKTDEEALAALYRKGMDAKRRGDLVTAADALARAAEGGHAGAGYEMGLLLKVGRKPIMQDLPRSQRFFLLAAEGGNMPAQYEVAQMFAQGVGVARNCTQAAAWARKAAEAGSPDAAVLLGELNLAECGGAKNPQEAARWFRVAADKGLAKAQFSLGVLYMNGDGVPKDLKEARKWLTAAASKGNTTARFYLRRLEN